MRHLHSYLLAGTALVTSATCAAAQQMPSASTASQTQLAASVDKGAQAQGEALPAAQSAAGDTEIVVTGSRIRQTTTNTSTTAPVAIIAADSIEKRGFVSASDVLKEMAAISPPTLAANSTGSNSALGSGQAAFGATYPNLFSLGAGRTLTLINGRRVISTAGGLGDEAVDPAIVPVGLLQRVDVVQGGGAAVYGSGAIGGVVNYIFKKNFQGVEMDAQGSIDQRGSYSTGSFRLTAGTNFSEGRGNVAINLDFSDTGRLLTNERDFLLNTPSANATLLPGAGANGIPVSRYLVTNTPVASWPGTVLMSPTSGVGALLLVNGSPVRFNEAGTGLAAFNPGTTTPGNAGQVTGGDYDRANQGVALVEAIPRVQRLIGNLVAGYDLTDDIRLSTEITVARVTGMSSGYRNFATQFTPTTQLLPGLQTLTFTRDNAYLTADTIAALSAASPTFANGGVLYLGKGPFLNLFEGNTADIRQPTSTYRGVVALDGKFTAGDRQFFWSAAATVSKVTQGLQGKSVIVDRLVKSANAVRNASGQIVCGVNADADPTNNDAACVPVNIFGTGDIGAAARNYLLVDSGAQSGSTLLTSENQEQDVLLTLSGDLVKVPAGVVRFATSYEYRHNSARFDPLGADHLGLTPGKVSINGASGKFSTNELAAELVVPVFGEGFNIPLFHELELNGSYRYVDHSVAGAENVWGAGARWGVIPGLTLRAALSRNFRAPNLRQLFLPASLALNQAISVCAPDLISQGQSPATRRANCLALFEANPTFGTATAPLGSSAEQRLATFAPIRIGAASVTTSGNPDLKNEISKTLSLGVVLEPKFLPGFVATVDRIDLKLRDALVSYGPAQFIATCFDSPAGTADDYCGTLGYDANGSIIRAVNRTVNAGSSKLTAYAFTMNYRFPLSRVFGGDNLGSLNLGVQGTYNQFKSETVGGSVNRQDNTRLLPRWVGGATVSYYNGPFTATYSNYYLARAKLNAAATPANSPDFMDYYAANLRHNISVQMEINNMFSVRAGINNFTDKAPSYPADFFNAYGDVIGRQFFLGAKMKL